MGSRRERWGALPWPGICRATMKALDQEAARCEEWGRAAMRMGQREASAEFVETASQHREQVCHLTSAQRVWVSADMVAAALDAAGDVPSFEAVNVPAAGFMGLAGHLPPVRLQHPLYLRGDEGVVTFTDPVLVDALGWWMDAGRVHVTMFTRTSRLPDPVYAVAAPLTVVEKITVPVGIGFEGMESRIVVPGGVTGVSRQGTHMMIRVASWLGAAWVLMATPTVAAPRVMDGRWGGVATDRTRSRDRVTVVEVRPMRQVHATTDSTGRRLTTRHVVRGHWTHQPYGVGRSRRRLQWIAPFIRGPQEAPFVATETVNVWRR